MISETACEVYKPSVQWKAGIWNIGLIRFAVGPFSCLLLFLFVSFLARFLFDAFRFFKNFYCSEFRIFFTSKVLACIPTWHCKSQAARFLFARSGFSKLWLNFNQLRKSNKSECFSPDAENPQDEESRSTLALFRRKGEVNSGFEFFSLRFFSMEILCNRPERNLRRRATS